MKSYLSILLGPLPITVLGNSYTLLFTGRFNRHDAIYVITVADFTTADTANILIDQYIYIYIYPSGDAPPKSSPVMTPSIAQTLPTQNTSGYSPTQLNTSSSHPKTNGGTERVCNTMTQILFMVANEPQNGWDTPLPSPRSACLQQLD